MGVRSQGPSLISLNVLTSLHGLTMSRVPNVLVGWLCQESSADSEEWLVKTSYNLLERGGSNVTVPVLRT